MIFFTSDQHFYHSNVIKYCNRPYASIEEMNEDLVKRHNEVVKPTDTVYHLGDFSLAHRAVTVILPRLNGTHHLIAGNHDHCHPAHYRSKIEKGERMRKSYYEAGFKTIGLKGIIEIADRQVNMSHLPYAGMGDHTDKGERYTEYRLAKSGLWLLHGHVHEAWHKNGKMINVGVDVWDFTPVSIDQIATVIRQSKETEIEEEGQK